jgi:DNA-binding MarR family transcriptional regulator
MTTESHPPARWAAATASAHEPLESGLGFRLGRAHRTLRQAWAERLVDLDLRPAQAALLRAACEWPDSGLRELARRTRSDAMNVKRLADGLEARGLLGSVADPSHRQRRVLRPTAAGRALADQIAARAADWNRHLGGLVGQEEYARLLALLTRLEDGVARERPADPPQGLR